MTTSQVALRVLSKYFGLNATRGAPQNFNKNYCWKLPKFALYSKAVMRKFLVLVFSLFVALNVNAQADYKQILQNTFINFDTSYGDMNARVNAGNKLILIAKKYPNDWYTQYYAAYSRAQLSYTEKDEAKRDAYLDEADNYLAEAVRLLGKDNDETHVVAAIIANARMAVKPQDRWQKYGKIFEDQLEAAKAINADNPRIYLQRGISKFYTPEMFGGGKKAAAPYFKKAGELFAKETGGDITQPYWGKGTNYYFLGLVNSEEKQ